MIAYLFMSSTNTDHSVSYLTHFLKESRNTPSIRCICFATMQETPIRIVILCNEQWSRYNSRYWTMFEYLMVAGHTKFAKLATAFASSDVFITEELATLASDYSVVNA